MLSKLWSIIRIQLSVNLAYRGNILFWLLIHLVGFIVLYCFWTAIYSDRELVQGIGFSQMISYLLAVSMIREFVLVAPEYEINSTIKSGKLSSYLVRPFAYPIHVLLSSSLWHMIETAMGIAIYLVIAYFLIPDMQWHWSWTILPLIILGHIISSLLSLCLGTLAFWLTEASAFYYYKEILIFLVGGILFPYQLMPTWVQQIMNILPFYGSMGLPAELLTNLSTTPNTSYWFLTLIIWSLMLLIASSLLWKRGVRHYEAIGG